MTDDYKIVETLKVKIIPIFGVTNVLCDNGEHLTLSLFRWTHWR